jgi:hypothetical protein
VPLTTVRADEIGPSGLSNQTVWFTQFRAGGSDSSSFCVQTNFGDSVEDSTTLSTSSMMGGNSGNNGFNLNKRNIFEPTFDTLLEDGHKTFDAYHANLEELFFSCCEVT